MIPKIMSYFGLNSLRTLLGIGGKFYGNVHSRVEHFPLEIEGIISILTGTYRMPRSDPLLCRSRIYRASIKFLPKKALKPDLLLELLG